MNSNIHSEYAPDTNTHFDSIAATHLEFVRTFILGLLISINVIWVNAIPNAFNRLLECNRDALTQPYIGNTSMENLSVT